MEPWLYERSFRYASPRLWNQLPCRLFSPSTSFKSLCLCPASSCSYHIFDTPVTTSNAQTADATGRASFGKLILKKIIKKSLPHVTF